MIPSLSVVQTVPSRRRNDAPALSSPPNPTEPSTSPATNHLNPTGTSSSRRPRSATTRSIIALETSVFPTATSRAPRPRPAEQVRDGRRQEVVRVEQAGTGRDDPVPVGVGVVAEREIESVAQPDETRHRVAGRGVHPDPTVPVDRHEAELRVDDRVRDRRDRGRSAPRSRASSRPPRHPAGRPRAAARTRRSRPGRSPSRGRRRRHRGSRAGRPAAIARSNGRARHGIDPTDAGLQQSVRLGPDRSR